MSSALSRERVTLEIRRARRPFVVLVAFLALMLGAGLVILRNNGTRQARSAIEVNGDFSRSATIAFAASARSPRT